MPLQLYFLRSHFTGRDVPIQSGDRMNRREFITLFGGAAAIWPMTAQAQSGRSRRIGVVMGYLEGDPKAQANMKAMRQGLQALGWIEGQNVTIDYRWPGGDPEKARTYARELVGMAPDLIVSSTNQVTAIVQQEASRIPIVFVFVGDPVGSGFAASLAKPGGNMTGFANFDNSTGGKWLELFSEVMPGAKRVGFVFNPDAAPNVDSCARPKSPRPHSGSRWSRVPFTIRSISSVLSPSWRSPKMPAWLSLRMRLR